MAIRDILANNVLMMTIAFAAGFAFGGLPALNSEFAMGSLVLVSRCLLGVSVSEDSTQKSTLDRR